jgi:hypothetical protein
MTQIVQSQATTGVTFGVLAAQCGEVLLMQVLRSGAASTSVLVPSVACSLVNLWRLEYPSQG